MFKSKWIKNGKRLSKLITIPYSSSRNKLRRICKHVCNSMKRGLKELMSTWNKVILPTSHAKKNCNSADKSTPRKCRSEIMLWVYLLRRVLILRQIYKVLMKRHQTNLPNSTEKAVFLTLYLIWRCRYQTWSIFQAWATARTKMLSK